MAFISTTPKIATWTGHFGALSVEYTSDHAALAERFSVAYLAARYPDRKRTFKVERHNEGLYVSHQGVSDWTDWERVKVTLAP